MKKNNVKRLVLAAVCTALCVVLPIAFHAIPNAGQVILPMHIPVLLCGLICSWPYGFICGLLGPLLSSLITGMPPAAMLPAMMIECATYGCISGLMLCFVHTKKVYVDLYICQIVAMFAGRFVAGLAKAMFLAPGTPVFAWVSTSLVSGIPGIVIQLAVLPTIVYALMRAKVIPMRYPHEQAGCN